MRNALVPQNTKVYSASVILFNNLFIPIQKNHMHCLISKEERGPNRQRSNPFQHPELTKAEEHLLDFFVLSTWVVENLHSRGHCHLHIAVGLACVCVVVLQQCLPMGLQREQAGHLAVV